MSMNLAHPVLVKHINGDTRRVAMWAAQCGRCGFQTDWVPTREDARIAAREHRALMRKSQDLEPQA